MTYNYKGRMITLDDTLVKDYEKMDGDAFINCIEYIIEAEKSEHPDFDMGGITDEKLSEIFTHQMKDELSVFHGSYE